MSLSLIFFLFFRVLLSIYYDVFCRRSIATVVVSSTISLFMSFRIDDSEDKVRFDRVIRSNLVRQYITDIKCYIF